jgi:hypothetical protein
MVTVTVNGAKVRERLKISSKVDKKEAKTIKDNLFKSKFQI